MGRIVAVVGSVIVITLGVLVGTKLSSDSISLIIGVIIGVVASLPTSVLLIWAFTRRSSAEQMANARMGQMGSGQYPPVVVVNPGMGMPTTWQQSQAPAMLPAAQTGQRRYDVVGELAEEAGPYAQER
jgi:hypothetical protein